jgi:hypothetical protein
MPDIGERIMPANYDNPIDTIYAHEHAAYERGYQDATTAMAEKEAEIERLRSIIGEAIARFRTDGQTIFADYLEKKAGINITQEAKQ